MSDDRFSAESTVFNKPLENRDRVSLEEFVERALEQGDRDSVALLINQLPEANREKYRELWKKMKVKS